MFKQIFCCVVTLCCAAAVAEKPATQIKLQNTKLVLSSGPLTLDFVVSPALEPEANAITLENLIDTDGKTVLSNMQVPGAGSSFSLKLDGKNKLQAGLYKMKVSVDKSTSVVLPLKVMTPVVIPSVTLNDEIKLKFGEKTRALEFSSGSDDSLKLDVQVLSKVDDKPLFAHQAFLRFTHADTEEDTVFPLEIDAKNKAHTLTLQFSLLSKRFAYRSGVHNMQLIVGDASFQKSVVWNLGSVDLLLGAAPPVAPPRLYSKPLLHESDTTLKALPEIKHIMRPQDHRPPYLVSLVFTGSVLAPLAGFLVYLVVLGVNVRRLFSASLFVYGVCFLGFVLAILLLFAWYWVQLTMFQTLQYLVVLGLGAIWFGHLTLKRLAQQDSVVGGNRKKKEE